MGQTASASVRREQALQIQFLVDQASDLTGQIIFTKPAVDHRALAGALRAIGWSKQVVVEMRATGTPLQTVRETLHRVMELYDLR